MIKDRTATVLEELNEKIKVLEIIDVDSIKAEDRIKLIVNENLNNYLGHIGKFVDYLSDLKEEEFEKMVYKINNIFADFNKKSYMSYQKATILIGKEMATTKESTIGLSKYFEKLFNENKDLLNLPKSISFIRLKLNQVKL